MSQNHVIKSSKHHPLDLEEIQLAVKIENKMWQNPRVCRDGVTAEHIKYVGPDMIKWLLNRIIVLEQIPSCLKEGTISPIYKEAGKDPLLTSSYRAIIVKALQIHHSKQTESTLE